MPQSQKPRKPRGTPQYQRDLQRGTPAPPARPQARVSAPVRPAAAKRPHGKLALAVGGGLAVGGALAASAHSRHIAHDLKRKQEVGKSALADALSRATKPENIERGARMVAAAAGEAKKPAKGAARARNTARAATKAAVPNRSKLKLVGGASAAAAGTGALFGAGSGLGHRTTDRRTTTAKAETATAVRRITTPKGPTGRFVSHENDLKVYTPRFKSTRRAPRGSRVQVWRKGGDATSKPWVSKSESGRSIHNPNRKGTRIS